MTWIANALGPQKFGNPTPRVLARSLTWVFMAAACSAFAAARTSADPNAIRVLIPAISAGLAALPIVAQMTEISLAPGSLLIGAWWWRVVGDTLVEAWSSPSERWIGRTVHGRWFAGSHTIRQSRAEHTRLLSACNQVGIPIRDQRAAWQASHPSLNILRSCVGACGLALVGAGVLLIVVLLVQSPLRIDWTWLDAAVAGLAVYLVSETIVELSARLDSQLAAA